MTSSTAILMREHQTILRVLASTEELVRRGAAADEPPASYAAIVDFLRSYADKLHHGKEEALLFPAMEARGIPPHNGPTEVMRVEHDMGRALVGRMASAVGDGDESLDLAAFGSAASEFVELLRAHIGKEDHILFPMAERLIDAAGHEELLQRYRSVEAEGFDDDVHERYESWAVEFAQRMGITQERFEARPACH